MNDTIPTFTTSNPGFLCDTTDRNNAFIEKMSGTKVIEHRRVITDCYLDGELERILGFDIPIFLSGTITGKPQDAIVWNVEGTVAYAATIEYKGRYTYIRMRNHK